MIRPATMGDHGSVVSMAQRAATVSGLPFKFDASYFGLNLSARIMSKDRLCLVLDRNDEILGFLLAAIVRSALFPVVMAQEEALWIEPKARGPWLRPFLNAYEEWSRENGVKLASIGTVNNERTERAFPRLGWKKMETHFWKEF